MTSLQRILILASSQQLRRTLSWLSMIALPMGLLQLRRYDPLIGSTTIIILFVVGIAFAGISFGRTTAVAVASVSIVATFLSSVTHSAHSLRAADIAFLCATAFSYLGLAALTSKLGFGREIVHSPSRTSELALAEVASDAAELLFQVDIDGRFTVTNPALQRILGYSEEELHQKPLRSVVHPQTIRRFEHRWKALSEGEQLRGIEACFITRDGRMVTAYGSLLPHFPRGGLARIYGILLDITDQKILQERLRRSEQQQRSLVTFTMQTLRRSDPGDLVKAFLSTAAEALTCPCAVLTEQGGSPATVISSFGIPGEHLARLGTPTLENDSVLIRDSSELSAAERSISQLQIHSSISVQVSVSPWGDCILTVYATSSQDFHPDDTLFLEALRNAFVSGMRMLHAFASLRETDVKYRALFETPAFGTVHWRAEGEIVEANQQFLTMIGYDQGEQTTAKLRWSELTPVEYAELDRNALVQIERFGYCSTYEKEFLHKDGKRIPVLVGATALPGNSREGIAFVHDMRQQVEARATRERLANIVESSDDPIISCCFLADVPIIETWNRAAERFFGYTAEESIGRAADFLFPIEERAAMSDLWRRLQSGESLIRFETVLCTKEKVRKSVSLTISLLLDHQRRVKGFSKIVRDLTERKRAQSMEAALLRSQRLEAVGRMAGGIAHEFNNLLSAALGHAELIALDSRVSANTARQAREIVATCERAATITSQLLSFSGQAVGDEKPRKIDLNQAIRDGLNILTSLVGENTQIDFAPGSGLQQVRFDLGQLTQLVMNLCMNARDAMPQGGRISISTSNCEFEKDGPLPKMETHSVAGVMLEVRDMGTGMTDEVKQHIFEPFFTTKEISNNPGLGLATIYAIVRRAGGKIEFESQPGLGTAFRIFFPADSEPERNVPSDVLVNAPDGAKVLLVEDDAVLRGAYSEYLRHVGIEIRDFGSATEALQCDFIPDILVTDIILPGMSGRELADKLMKNVPTVKVLFMSGYRGDFLATHGFEDGRSDFIQKPFAMGTLIERIGAMLAKNG